MRGTELLKQGQIDDAQQVFRAALELDEGNPRVLALLGLTHFRAGQFDAARPIYERLVERAPTDASHRLNLGLVYLKVGDASSAIDALEASRALDPSQGRAVNYLGLAYARAGRYVEAYRAFLIAGQKELASEIEINLTASERDAIQRQLQPRAGAEPAAEPPAVARTSTPLEPAVPRTSTPPRPPPRPSAERGAVPPAAEPEAEPQTDAPPASAAWFAPHPAAEPEAEPEPQFEAEPAAPAEVDGVPVPNDAAQHDSHPDIQVEPRLTESAMFVLPPQATPVPEPAKGDERSILTRAVDAASAAPVAAAAGRGPLTGTPPMPLSQLATTALVRPDDGDYPFEVADNGSLVIRVIDRVLTRLQGVHVTGGDLNYEPAMRRSRGHQTEEPFTYGSTPLHTVEGRGYLIALPGEQVFTAVALDDDILYLREDLVFAFEPALRWENGNVPGLRGRLPVVQFRGDGSLVLRSKKPLVRVKLPASGVVFVDASRLAGWIGRVIPRAVVSPHGGPMGEVCVECTGEGIVLVDPVGDPGPPPEPEREKRVTAPPPPPTTPDAESVEGLAADLGSDDARDEF